MNDQPDAARRTERRSKLLVIALVGIFAFGMLGFAFAVIDAEATPSLVPPPSLPALSAEPAAPTPPGETAQRGIRLALAEPAPSASAAPTAPAARSPAPSASSGASPDPSLLPASEAGVVTTDMPVVPVVGFWSRKDGLSTAQVRQALRDGKLKGHRRVVVEEGIADDLVESLGIEPHPDVRRLPPDRLAKAVSRGSLGLVAATSLRPSMRALAVDGRALLGNDRVARVARWPLVVRQQRPAAEAWDQGRTWVLVAGGDSFTDRGVYDRVVLRSRGMGYPFGGGTATVTGHGCCDPRFHENIVPRYRLTGGKGIVRELFRSAELAMLNHEQPVTDGWSYHESGLRFSGKPELTRIFTRAGIDFLSLANNHIGDYGADGISDSRRILRRYGLVAGGAGKDLEQARTVQLLDAGGTRVAIIPCLDFLPVYQAGEGKAGATPCVDQYIRNDIRKAKRAGAQVIIVFPHWGTEYSRRPSEAMRRHAGRWVDAGATMVVGAHSHVAGAIEEVDGAPVLYSLGNFLFDQDWSTNTMESVVLEATFHGDRLLGLRLWPYIVHDQAQPNLLDPAKGEGRRLLTAVKSASSDWLDW